MSDDPLDLLPSFARVSVAAVLVSGDADPRAALAEAGITDPVAVEIRIGDTVDPSQGILGDGVTPNLTAVLETRNRNSAGACTAGQQPASGFLEQAARSVPGDAFNLPPAFGLRPVAPVRGSGVR